MKKVILAAALCAVGIGALITVSPAAAQKSAMDPGIYWDVQDVRTEPGHTEEYLDFLKAKFKTDCDWQVSKGYMVGCKVLANVNRRKDEPDLVLIRMFKEIPSVAEQKRRDDEFQALAKMDSHALDADGRTRAPIRKLGDDVLWQELDYTK